MNRLLLCVSLLIVLSGCASSNGGAPTKLQRVAQVARDAREGKEAREAREAKASTPLGGGIAGLLGYATPAGLLLSFIAHGFQWSWN
jgi:hypothetical protein